MTHWVCVAIFLRQALGEIAYDGFGTRHKLPMQLCAERNGILRRIRTEENFNEQTIIILRSEDSREATYISYIGQPYFVPAYRYVRLFGRSSLSVSSYCRSER